MYVHRHAALLFGLVLLAAAGVLAWLTQRSPPRAVPAPATPIATAPASIPLPAPPLEHPIAAVEARVTGAAPDATPAGVAGIAAEIEHLLGREAVLRMLQMQDFPRRLAATVDNLGREAAPAQAWPVNPTPGRFLVREDAGRLVIDPDNGLRYAPFVQLVESVDLRDAVALYVRLYPELQQAYEALGFPGRHFNTRLVQVVDLLLATPRPDGPIEVVLPTIRGPHQPVRPWVLYEFADPAWRSLTAGQQWLLRMGPVNQRRLQARLAELRPMLARPVVPSPNR